MSARTPRRNLRPPAVKGRSAGPFSPSMLLAVVIGGLIVCSLLATSVGTAFLGGKQPTGVPEAEGNEYEGALRDAIAANPDDVVALASMANLAATRGDHREAIGFYERAIELDPDNGGIRLDFALSLAESGNLDDAELQYERVLEREPGNAEALYFLGELYARWQPERNAEAAAAFERAIAAEPGSVSASQAEIALARVRGRATPVGSPGT